MKTASAIKTLKKAGYSIIENMGSYIASKGSDCISFSSYEGKTKNFTFDSADSCSPTFGMTLRAAMS
jgi:hypothetical protein